MYIQGDRHGQHSDESDEMYYIMDLVYKHWC